MSLNLRLLNLFIGMCKGAAGLPRDLYELGFRDEGVEIKFTNSERRTVAPELIISSERLHHTVLFEWKEGPNTDADQLRRYSRVETNDLVEKALLTRNKCGVHDFTIIGLGEHRERLPIGVADGGYEFPVLVTVPNGIEPILNRFHLRETDAVFRPLLEINWATLPTWFFPLDAESELWEFAEHAIPLVLQDMQRGVPRILASDLLRRMVPHWDTMRNDYKTLLLQRIETVMDRASRREFSQNLTRNTRAKARTGSATWDVRENPLVGEADKRHKAFRRMRTRQANLIAYFKDPQRQEELALRAAEDEDD